MEVIILDGNQRSALAVTRSLGKKGIKVAVAEDVTPCLSSVSRYCYYSFSYASPYTNPDGFIETIQQVSAKYNGSMLFPMTDVTLSEVLKNKEYLSNHVKIPFPDYDKYISVSDKESLLCLAKDLNILTPKTLFSNDFKRQKELISEANYLDFPLVLKNARSRIRTANGWINASVQYVKNINELKKMLNDEPFKSYPFLIQERIEGPGMGIFLLMHQGNVIARFAHQRIREKPPSGGVSVLCQSTDPPPEALEAVTRLLESLKWSGVAMGEFKWDERDNTPKLMEVNARFWGSLQLAISAGVDFPYLLYCFANGKEFSFPSNYKVGIKSRWELGDLDHLLIRLKQKNSDLSLPLNAHSKRKVLKDYICDFFRPSVRNEVFRPSDPRPFVFELKQYLRNIIL